MARNQRDRMLDGDLILKDAGLVAADAAATVGGSAAVLDLGDVRMDGVVQIDATAIEVASNDELFLITAQFSDSSTFASGILNGPTYALGAFEISKQSADSATGRYEMGVSNEINGTTYRYMRLYTECQGSIATGINYSARLMLV